MIPRSYVVGQVETGPVHVLVDQLCEIRTRGSTGINALGESLGFGPVLNGFEGQPKLAQVRSWKSSKGCPPRSHRCCNSGGEPPPSVRECLTGTHVGARVFARESIVIRSITSRGIGRAISLVRVTPRDSPDQTRSAQTRDLEPGMCPGLPAEGSTIGGHRGTATSWRMHSNTGHSPTILVHAVTVRLRRRLPRLVSGQVAVPVPPALQIDRLTKTRMVTATTPTITAITSQLITPPRGRIQDRSPGSPHISPSRPPKGPRCGRQPGSCSPRCHAAIG